MCGGGIYEMKLYTYRWPVSHFPNKWTRLLVAKFVWQRFLASCAQLIPNHCQWLWHNIHTLHQSELFTFSTSSWTLQRKSNLQIKKLYWLLSIFYLSPLSNLPQVSPPPELVACVSVTSLGVQWPGVCVTVLVRQGLAQMVLTPHQSVGHSTITGFVTLVPLSIVPSRAGLLIARVLTWWLHHTQTHFLFYLLALTVKTFNLSGFLSPTTSCRTGAPVTMSPNIFVVFTFNLCIFCVHQWPGANHFFSTCLFRVGLLNRLTMFSINFVSSILIDAEHLPPPDPWTTGTAAQRPISRLPISIYTVRLTLLGIFRSWSHLSTSTMVLFKSSFDSIITCYHPLLNTTTLLWTVLPSSNFPSISWEIILIPTSSSIFIFRMPLSMSSFCFCFCCICVFWGSSFIIQVSNVTVVRKYFIFIQVTW